MKKGEIPYVSNADIYLSLYPSRAKGKNPSVFSCGSCTYIYSHIFFVCFVIALVSAPQVRRHSPFPCIFLLNKFYRLVEIEKREQVLIQIVSLFLTESGSVRMVVVTPHHFLSLSCVPVKTRLVEFHLCRRFVMFFFFFFFFLWGVCCFPSGAPVDGERGLCFYFRFEKKKKKRHFSGRTFLFVPLPLFYSLLFFFCRREIVKQQRTAGCIVPVHPPPLMCKEKSLTDGPLVFLGYSSSCSFKDRAAPFPVGCARGDMVLFSFLLQTFFVEGICLLIFMIFFLFCLMICLHRHYTKTPK